MHDSGIWEWNVKSDQLNWSARIYEMLGLDPAAERAHHAAYQARFSVPDEA